MKCATPLNSAIFLERPPPNFIWVYWTFVRISLPLKLYFPDRGRVANLAFLGSIAGQDCMMDDALYWLRESVGKDSEWFYVHPWKIVRSGESESVSATKLTYGVVSTIDDINESDDDFVGVPLTNINVDTKKYFDLIIDNLEDRRKRMKIISAEGAIASCTADVCVNYEMLQEGLENEATLRFAIADPLVKMLCRLYDYKVRLEESVKDDDSPVNVSKKSRADYVCYRVEDSDHSTVAIVVETKNDPTNDAIAQTIGYYGRTTTDANKPGVAMVLTSTQARFLFFPFRANRSYGVNSLLLPTIKFSQEDFVKFRRFLAFVILISNVRADPITLPSPAGVSIFSSKYLKGILTQDELIQLLQHELQTTKVENQELQTALQTTKQELQTTNNELKVKLAELPSLLGLTENQKSLLEGLEKEIMDTD